MTCEVDGNVVAELKVGLCGNFLILAELECDILGILNSVEVEFILYVLVLLHCILDGIIYIVVGFDEVAVVVVVNSAASYLDSEIVCFLINGETEVSVLCIPLGVR